MALASSGSKLYIGGRFTHVDGVLRRGIAAVDTRTGDVDPRWHPNVRVKLLEDDARINALAVSGSRVYAGGYFTNVDLYWRFSLVALDSETGRVDVKWSADTYWRWTGTVNTLAASASRVYVGGRFVGVADQPRNRLAAIDADTGAVEPWNPNVGLDGDYSYGMAAAILDLHLTGDRLYAGGVFRTIGERLHSDFAAFGPSD